MEKNVTCFVEKITDNFSSLFVETLFIRYIDEFGKENIENDIAKIIPILNKKLNQKISKKLNKK